MRGIDGMKEPEKKKIVMFVLVDCSYSMNGSKMDALNEAMRAIVQEIKDFETTETRVKVEIACLLFGVGDGGNECRWLSGEPERVKNFEWTDQVAEGWTPMAKALDELSKKMSRNSFLDSPSASGAPIVIILTDGMPCTNGCTSEQDLEMVRKSLKDLNNNRWFENSIKAAISIGTAQPLAILSEITGSPKTVFDVKNSDQLKDILKFIAVDSVVISSTVRRNTEEASVSEDNQSRFEESCEQKQEEKKEEENASGMNSAGWS